MKWYRFYLYLQNHPVLLNNLCPKQVEEHYSVSAILTSVTGFFFFVARITELLLLTVADDSWKKIQIHLYLKIINIGKLDNYSSLASWNLWLHIKHSLVHFSPLHPSGGKRERAPEKFRSLLKAVKGLLLSEFFLWCNHHLSLQINPLICIWLDYLYLTYGFWSK